MNSRAGQTLGGIHFTLRGRDFTLRERNFTLRFCLVINGANRVKRNFTLRKRKFTLRNAKFSREKRLA